MSHKRLEFSDGGERISLDSASWADDEEVFPCVVKPDHRLPSHSVGVP